MENQLQDNFTLSNLFDSEKIGDILNEVISYLHFTIKFQDRELEFPVCEFRSFINDIYLQFNKTEVEMEEEKQIKESKIDDITDLLIQHFSNFFKDNDNNLSDILFKMFKFSNSTEMYKLILYIINNFIDTPPLNLEFSKFHEILNKDIITFYVKMFIIKANLFSL